MPNYSSSSWYSFRVLPHRNKYQHGPTSGDEDSGGVVGVDLRFRKNRLIKPDLL